MKNRTMTLKRSTVTLVTLVVLAALLLACGAKEALVTVPAGAQAVDRVSLQSCTYEVNKVEYDTWFSAAEGDARWTIHPIAHPFGR